MNITNGYWQYNLTKLFFVSVVLFDMNEFTIKDLENLSGVKAHTIRIWEQRYNFLKPRRTETNIRYYSNEELKSVLNIALLNKYGYKISFIDKMSKDEIGKKLQQINQHEAQQERLINELISYTVDLDMESFEELINKEIRASDIQKAIDKLIFPFLEKIGILWLSNKINPAQEHLVFNIIRQKLLLAIDKCPKPDSAQTVVLFLPENEHHELGLIYVNYLLRQMGVRTFYLGANVPSVDLEYVVKVKNPTFLYSHITSVSNKFNMEKFIAQLQYRVKNIPVFLSGPMVVAYDKYLPANIHIKHSLIEVKKMIENIS